MMRTLQRSSFMSLPKCDGPGSKGANRILQRLPARSHRGRGALQCPRQFRRMLHAFAVAAMRRHHLLERGAVREFGEPPTVLFGRAVVRYISSVARRTAP